MSPEAVVFLTVCLFLYWMRDRMPDWKSIRLDDIRPGNVRTGPHAFTQKLLHWRYCKHCGLLTLRNEETLRAMRRTCSWEED